MSIIDRVVALDHGAIRRVLAIDGGAVPAVATPPSTDEMLDALERVNPFTPTQLVISADLWDVVGPAYDRLAQALVSAEKSGSKHDKRAAWKQWRAFIRRTRNTFRSST